MEATAQAAKHAFDLPTILVAAIGILLVAALLSRSWVASRVDGGTPPFVAALIVVATCPIWGSILLIFFGSFESRSTGYWGAAPWLVIYSTFKYTSYSIWAAIIAGAAYFLPRGKRTHRLACAIISLVTVLAGAAVLIASEAAKSRQAKVDEREEKRAVEAFVTRDASVARRLPEATDTSQVVASVLSSRSERAQLPFQYFVVVRPTQFDSRRLEVVVDVTRTDDGVAYRVACFVKENEDWVNAADCRRSSGPE